MAVSIIAANSSITATIEMNLDAAINSLLPLRCTKRQISQTLSANAIEYARNSNQVNGKINKTAKAKRGDTLFALLSAAT